MPLHVSTFEYVSPTEAQIEAMGKARGASRNYANTIETLVPDGPDKTYILRKLREVAMWINVALTRQPDGSPRS